MAIYSCNLTSIGRTTHLAGTAGAHIRYIARPEAKPVIIAEHMPAKPVDARNWIDRAERASRKNARVLDKIRIALPRELDTAQRVQLVREFMADLTGGARVPWFAAIHQSGDDALNPHVHIDVHDRDLDSGRRVLRLSDSTRDRLKAGLPGPKAVQWIRERWEVVCNRALAQAGHDVRIDRRTLEAQGIDRRPTIHEGPRASHINDAVKRPHSKSRVNGCGRTIDYPSIDKGKTRREFNAHVIDLNLERAARSGNPEAAAWAQFERQQQGHDRQLEKQLARDRREHTGEARTASLHYTAQVKRERAAFKLKARQSSGRLRDQFATRRESLRARQAEERGALRQKQKGLIARIARRLSRGIRARHLATRVQQIERHRAERMLLSRSYQHAKKQARDSLAAQYTAIIAGIEAKRTAHLEVLREHHRQAEGFADIIRQQREAEREQERALTETRIQEWKKLHRTSDEFTHTAKGPPPKSDAIARAIAKVKEKEEEERRSKGRDQGRERGR